MKRLPGVFEAKKKDGSIYYRASITFRSKHISLGSFPTELQAGQAYKEAKLLLETPTALTPDDYPADSCPVLSFAKWISLINFKNNGFYIKTPIYLRSNFFSYYLSPTDVLTFDADDLFYYSNHSIMLTSIPDMASKILPVPALITVSSMAIPMTSGTAILK